MGFDLTLYIIYCTYYFFKKIYHVLDIGLSHKGRISTIMNFCAKCYKYIPFTFFKKNFSHSFFSIVLIAFQLITITGFEIKFEGRFQLTVLPPLGNPYCSI